MAHGDRPSSIGHPNWPDDYRDGRRQGGVRHQQVMAMANTSGGGGGKVRAGCTCGWRSHQVRYPGDAIKLREDYEAHGQSRRRGQPGGGIRLFEERRKALKVESERRRRDALRQRRSSRTGRFV